MEAGLKFRYHPANRKLITYSDADGGLALTLS